MPPTHATFRRRAHRVVRQFLPVLAVLSAAACGGGGDPITGGSGTSTTTFNVTASFVLASTTTSGLTLRTTPVYELAAGGTKALAVTSTALSSTSAQTVPVTVDITACLADPARAGATSTGSGSCRVQVEFALLAGARVVDAQTFGTYTVSKGLPNGQAVTFSEVTGVRVTNAASEVVANGAAVRAVVGSALTLTAAAVRADNAIVTRPVTWSSDNAAVAAVDASTGAVTPVSPGTARVTATVAGVSSSVVVTVVPGPSAVTVAASGPGSGTVTSAPARLSCRVTAGTIGACSASFASDSAVILTAAPDAGSAFGVWGDACASAGSALSCTLPASSTPRTASVRFTVLRTLAVSLVGSAGSGGGRVQSTNVAGIDCQTNGAAGCTASFADGASVTLTATPNAGNRFDGWSGGGCSGTGACTVTMDQARSVSATFTVLPNPVPFSVTVASSTAAEYRIDLVYDRFLNGVFTSTRGTITTVLSSAAAQPSLTVNADDGTSVTLTLRPNATGPSGAGRILSWGGACAGTAVTSSTGENSCTFRQSANANVVVNVGP